MMNDRVTIRPEAHRDYRDIVSLILRSFREGTDYSDGTDIIALVEEIRDSQYYIPELSFVAEMDGKVVGHFLFSRFPLSATPNGGHGDGAPELSCWRPYPCMRTISVRGLAPRCSRRASSR